MRESKTLKRLSQEEQRESQIAEFQAACRRISRARWVARQALRAGEIRLAIWLGVILGSAVAGVLFSDWLFVAAAAALTVLAVRIAWKLLIDL